jgi:hypothetical protein
MNLTYQLIWLFTLAIPIACVAWTVTHEEVFKEVHEYCLDRSKNNKTVFGRKFFYLFTCEYCFSHYVTILFLLLTNFKLLLDDWRGYIIAGFALVFIANLYMSIYVRIKVEIKKERIIAQKEEEKLKS